MSEIERLFAEIEIAKEHRDRAVRFRDFDRAYQLDDAIIRAQASYGSKFEMLAQAGRLARMTKP